VRKQVCQIAIIMRVARGAMQTACNSMRRTGLLIPTAAGSLAGYRIDSMLCPLKTPQPTCYEFVGEVAQPPYNGMWHATQQRTWARLSFQNLERMAPMATSLSGSTRRPTRPVKELVMATMRPKFFTPNSAFTICAVAQRQSCQIRLLPCDKYVL